MFAHILVPLDGSAPAEEALPVAARIVRASRGSIHLLEVVSSPIDFGRENDWDPLLSEQEIETEITVATDYFRTMVALPMLDGSPGHDRSRPWTPGSVCSGSRQVRGVRSDCAEQPRQDGFQALGAGQRCTHAGA
jgi:hypothetical protein